MTTKKSRAKPSPKTSPEDETRVATIFLVDSEGYGEDRAKTILGHARQLAAHANVPFLEAVTTLAKALAGQPKRMMKLGIDTSGLAPDEVLTLVSSQIEGGSGFYRVVS
jgi:hypothetical protein